MAEEDKDEEEEEVPEQTQETAVPTPEDQPSKDIVFSTLDFGDDASAPSQKKRKKPIASLIKKVFHHHDRLNYILRTISFIHLKLARLFSHLIRRTWP